MKEYVREKMRMLREFCIQLTSQEQEYMHSLQSEVQIDNFVRDLIMRKL